MRLGLPEQQVPLSMHLPGRCASQPRIVLRGLRFALVHDPSVLYKLIVSLPVLLLSLYYHPWVDTALVPVVAAVMLAAEIFNTAIEAMCDIIQPEDDRRVAMVKDSRPLRLVSPSQPGSSS